MPFILPFVNIGSYVFIVMGESITYSVIRKGAENDLENYFDTFSRE